MSTVQVYESREYHLFAKHPLSRDLSDSNLRALSESISDKSLLDSEIIQVTPNKGEYPEIPNTVLHLIFNGNHRMETAKNLGISFFYTVKENISPLDIAKQFQASAKWGIDQILKFFCKLNYGDYLRFKKFADDYELDIKVALPLVKKPTNRAHNRRSFLKGTFSFDSEIDLIKRIEKAHIFLDLGKKKFLFTKKKHMRVPFYDGFFRLLEMKDFDWDYFINKHIEIGCPITKHIDATGYYNQLHTFYFHDKKKPREKKVA
jgi:hypothetical protein